MARTRARRNGWLLALASLLLALGALEAGLRLFFKKGVLLESGAYYYTDLDGERRHIPGSSALGPHWDGKGLVEYKVNARGFLDDELPATKRPGERRVLVLGDSVVMAGKIHRKDSFVERLEPALSRALGAPVEAINAGVGDAGLSSAHRVLVEQGFAAEPDLILLGVYLNDSRPPLGFADERLLEHPLLRALRTWPLLRRSRLARFVVFKLYQLGVARRGRQPSVSQRFAWVEEYRARRWLEDPAALERLVRLARYDWGAAWAPEEMESLLSWIEKIHRACAARKLRFAVMLFPVDAQLAGRAAWNGIGRPQQALRYFLEQNGVPYLDLRDAFKGKDIAKLYYDHCHLTPAGHDEAAKALRPFLVSLLK